MVSPFDKEYELTKKIKRGNSQLDFPFDIMAKWIQDTFGLRPLNIIYDLLPHDKRPRLQVIFDREIDYGLFVQRNGMFPDKIKGSKIIQRFNKIVADLQDYTTDNIFIVFSSFEKLAKEETNILLPDSKIKSIKDKVDLELWEIYKDLFSVVFFFYTDQQVEKYSSDGITKSMLEDLCFDLLKEYDEFGYLNKNDFKIQFDSKENFDNNYESNWFYYSKR